MKDSRWVRIPSKTRRNSYPILRPGAYVQIRGMGSEKYLVIKAEKQSLRVLYNNGAICWFNTYDIRDFIT